ncbi:hypothetical protein PUNSTDRAFT_142555 [Punctularia strigosozonata HHB-11173 SS5]|uniref:uncharacterized protein n=1 Tax=Punctularia strigosozonata (strain HHB-11173) TaxID=741275 RepID=UPI000441763A|nr:uncharacterized protein PUNSTDRAFT_142555 [Punctularia strigosozonata HHB-11173 SS5]EIN10575.1 hypothetical protein PUNSTDRAFT_142555 [Punctularia strigosozonata HHB-11173 SS5]
MPRVLPRLLDRLAKTPFAARDNGGVDPSFGRNPKRRWRYPSTSPLPAPSFSPAGRAHSLLLDDADPISNSKLYVRQKRPPPAVRVHANQKREIVGADGRTRRVAPHRMSALEREWWSNPYLRMLASPVRCCMMSDRSLPNDFLVRLAAVRLPTPRGAREATLLVPDGLQHPRYTNKRVGKGRYVVCRASAVDALGERAHYRRYAPNLSHHALLGRQIGHLLRLRALQELRLLAASLSLRPRGALDHPLIRRLTRAEFDELAIAGSVPWEGAAAVLVVPPVNRDKNTGKRPRPEAGMALLPLETEEITGRKALPPSVMYQVVGDGGDGGMTLSRAGVPLYNGVAMFPDREQRAALHQALSEVLKVERRARFKEEGRRRKVESAAAQEDATEKDTTPKEKKERAKGGAKMSHAFLICSDADTLLRADAVPFLIALWRVRMWEGGGFDDNPPPSQWEVARYTQPQSQCSGVA